MFTSLRKSCPTITAVLPAALLLCVPSNGHEARLGSLSDIVLPHRFVISSNSRHVAFVVESESGQAAVVDGRRGKWYESVGRLLLNDNGTYAYAAMRHGRGVVVRDGREGKPYVSVGEMALSPDGRLLAHPAKLDSGWALVVNGKETALHDDIRWLVRDNATGRIAYTAQDGDSWRVFVDGAPGAGWDEVAPPRFSDDGRRVVHTARRGEEWSVVLEGIEYRSAGGIAGPILLGPDSGFAWVTLDGGRARVMKNGLPGPEFDYIIEFAATPDLGTMAYAARDGERWSVLLNDSVVAASNVPPAVRLARNGRLAAAIQLDSVRQAVFLDGETGRPHAEIGVPLFSPDGSRVAFTVTDGGLSAVVLDGEQHRYYEAVARLEFGPDSKRFAYAVRRTGRWSVVVDGKEGPWFDAIIESPSFFGPDGTRVAYAVFRDGKRYIVTGGTVLEPAYDGIRQVVFDDNDRVSFVALRGDTIVVVAGRRLPQ